MAIIDIENVTNPSNTGIFDKLMESINKNIETQYLNNRITGSDYATVYLGSIQAALTQSIQFSLQEDTVAAQVDEVLDSTIRANTQLNDSLLTTTKQRLLLDEQIKVTYTERVLKDKQAAKLGMDNVMKLAEDSRTNIPSFVYTPIYVGV
jgi:hypothetical protein